MFIYIIKKTMIKLVSNYNSKRGKTEIKLNEKDNTLLRNQT